LRRPENAVGVREECRRSERIGVKRKGSRDPRKATASEKMTDGNNDDGDEEKS
jgi:ribosomal protein L4